VQYVLEGSVRRAGNSLRITAQLIDARADAHIWAEKYSGTLDDVFDIQEKVSRAIVEALRVALAPDEARRLAEHLFDNAAAYDCYMRASSEANSYTRDGLARAEEHLRLGMQIAGEAPVILAGLAYLRFQQVNMGFGQDETLSQAKDFAWRALALDPTSPQAHAALGAILVIDGDVRNAARHLERAVAGAPADVMSALWLAWGYAFAANGLAHAAGLLDDVRRRDPLHPMVNLLFGVFAFLDGRFDEAADLGEAFYRMAPGSSMFLYWFSIILAYAGRADRCREILATVDDAAAEDALIRTGLIVGRAGSGDLDGVNALMTAPYEASARRDGQTSWNLAACFARLGERERALRWIENAVDRGFVPVTFFERLDPFLAPLRGEPRFGALMEQARQKERAFVV
jgi:tetratricopeptide (TPR) repeat protein